MSLFGNSCFSGQFSVMCAHGEVEAQTAVTRTNPVFLTIKSLMITVDAEVLLSC